MPQDLDRLGVRAPPAPTRLTLFYAEFGLTAFRTVILQNNLSAFFCTSAMISRMSIRTIRCFSRLSVEGEYQIAGRSCAKLKRTSLFGAGADWLSSSNSCSLLSSSFVF